MEDASKQRELNAQKFLSNEYGLVQKAASKSMSKNYHFQKSYDHRR